MSKLGSIVAFGSTFAPEGYLFCDGAEYLAADYPELYAVIGNQYGGIFDQSFMVPDLRGEFLRGSDLNSQLPGEKQEASTAMPDNLNITVESAGNHSHTYSDFGYGAIASGIPQGGVAAAPGQVSKGTSAAGLHTHELTIEGGAEETRPQNMGVLYCICAKEVAGPTGATGPQGPAGADGRDGVTTTIVQTQYINNPVPYYGGGPTGATGATGAAGPEGPQGAPGFGAYAHARVQADGAFVANRGFASCGLTTTGNYRYEFAQPMADENYTVLADVNIKQIGQEAKIIGHDTNGFDVYIGKSNTKPFDTAHSVIVIV